MHYFVAFVCRPVGHLTRRWARAKVFLRGKLENVPAYFLLYNEIYIWTEKGTSSATKRMFFLAWRTHPQAYMNPCNGGDLQQKQRQLRVPLLQFVFKWYGVKGA